MKKSILAIFILAYVIFFDTDILGALSPYIPTQQKIKSFEENAEQGDLRSQMLLGIFYRDGSGVQQDYQKVKKYFEMGAKKENAISEFGLGLIYANGYGVRQNYAVAKEFFGKSCGHGFQDGCEQYKMLNIR